MNIMLRHVRDAGQKHTYILDASIDLADCLCELNVIEQARNVGNATVLQDAWARGQTVTVHGWIYALHDGLLRDLGFVVDSPDALECGYRAALSAVAKRASAVAR